MLFKEKNKFTILEIRESGVRITHYVNGSKEKIDSTIEEFKNRAKDYERVGSDGMVVWV